MTGLLVLLLLVVVMIGGISMWVRRSRIEPGAGPDSPHDTEPGRVSLLTEAIGYLGTILVLAGAVAAVGQHWKSIPFGGRTAVLGCAALLFFGVGLFVRSSTEPAFQRLTSVTWAVSVAAFAGCAGAVNQFYDTSPETAFLTVAIASTAYAGLLWWFLQRALQQAVLFLGILLSTSSVILRAVHHPADWMVAVPLWAIGLAWAGGGWSRRITPWFTAVPIGLLVALLAPTGIDTASGLRFGLGIGTAAGVMALGVAVEFTPGLAMASVAMLGYLIGALIFYFGNALGVPVALAIGGLLILLFAATATHWHWFGRKHPPAGQPPSPTGDASAGHSEHQRAA